MAKQQQNFTARNIANNAIVRMQQRIAAVQALRATKHQQRIAARNAAAYQAALQQLAAQYGMQAPKVSIDLHARANSATVAPSAPLVTVQGVAYKPCKAVHALCDQLVQRNPDATRAEMLQLCRDNGINAATASTQVGLYRKARAAALEEQAAEQE